MKKRIALFLSLALVLTAAGCGSNTTEPSNSSPAPVQTAAPIPAAESKAEPGAVTKAAAETPAETKTAADPAAEAPTESAPLNIDIDLTALSSTMVYAEVYNMMVSPDKYVGKTVKMKGLFAYYHDEATGNYYFACIIQDATACCAQGIEFVLSGEHSFPDDYPQTGDEICVVGVFDTYREGEYLYCTLRNAAMLEG